MRIEYTGRQTEVSRELRALAERKLAKLARVLPGITHAHVILTSDNPRSEDPASIIEEIKRGLVPPERPLRRNGQAVAPIRQKQP